MLPDAPRAQLIHIETDRRLGHEWDEWDGKPLPGNGDFSARPGLFFQRGALTLVVGFGAAGALVFLLAPRLESLHALLPTLLWLALGGAAGLWWLWVGLLLLFFFCGAGFLSGQLVGRGADLRLVELPSFPAPVLR